MNNYDPSNDLVVERQRGLVPSADGKGFDYAVQIMSGGAGGGGGAITAADGAIATMGSTTDAAWDTQAPAATQVGILKKAALFLSTILSTLQGVLNVNDGTAKLTAGDNRKIQAVTTSSILFSDDFGGTALDTTKWDVFDGGIAPIGSGVSMLNNGGSIAVSNSILSVTMGKTLNAELWLLSKQIFSCTEDITFSASLATFLAQNSIRIGLVEVDPTTGNIVPNPTNPAQFNNAGGLEYAATTNSTSGTMWAIADGSPNETVTNSATLTSSSKASAPAQDVTIEYHAEDIIASSCNADAATARSNSILRISSQVPNDGKAYKLLLRFRNITSAPSTSTVFELMRIIVSDGHEMRVEVASGRGDTNAQKGVAVTLAGSTFTPSASSTIGSINAIVSGYLEYNGTGLAAGASYAGSAHNPAYAASFFNAFAVTDQPGTLAIEYSSDNGTNWYPIQANALNQVVADGKTTYAATLRQPIVTVPNSAPHLYRAWIQNTGSAQQTFIRLLTSMTFA